jgi:NMD protein affecting ribosome stability and mRNA decay
MSKVVTFLEDIYPYVVGDVVRLEEKALAEIEKIAKGRKLSKVYEEVSTTVDSTEDTVKEDAAKVAKATKAAEAKAKADADAAGKAAAAKS